MAEQRYVEIPNEQDIYAGAEGKVKTVKDITDFLTGWADWLAQIITTIRSFFADLFAPDPDDV